VASPSNYVVEPEENNVSEECEDNELLDIIDMQYWDDYEDWKRIMWAVKKEGYSKGTAQKYSKQSSKYTDEGFELIWRKSPKNITISQGTINYYAKHSNPDKYFDIKKTLVLSIADIDKG
jgi:hypothetical protein